MTHAEFPDAAHFWHLDRLFADLSTAKLLSDCSSSKSLSKTERLYLTGLLSQCRPSEIAKRCYVSSGTVRSCLSDRLYPYLKILAKQKAGHEPDIKDWSEVAPLLEQLGYKQRLFSDETDQMSSSWVGAPETGTLFGRGAELVDLKRDILSDQRKIVALTGVEGIGKTALAATLARYLEENHNYQVLWISMVAAPLPEAVIDQIQRLWGSQTPSMGLTLEAHWQHLIQSAAGTPWLVVLDGMETTVKNCKYTEAHQNFKRLFRQVCETDHHGQFLVTSSQHIANFCILEEKGLPVRLCKLKGLDSHAAGKLLEHLNVECKSPKDCENIRKIYNGNPQFIRFFATSIREIFNGKLTEFTELNTVLLDEQMQLLLDMQWQRLSVWERRIAHILSESRAALPVAELRQHLNDLSSACILINSLRHLKECEFIEQVSGKTKEESRYQLRPLIQKYLADYLS